MGNGPEAPSRLCCEFIENPLGITSHPTFSWWVNDPRPAEVQSAFEIQAASSAERLAGDTADLWMSGRIESSNNAHVPYQGLPAGSGQQIFWRVRTYDSDGVASPWSPPAFFEMGLLRERDFMGEWISGGNFGHRHGSAPVAILRHDFELTRQPHSARLYLGLKGHAEVFINHLSVAELKPVWADFSRSYPRYALDVTEVIKSGMNSLTILLADGIYAGALPKLGREFFGAVSQIKGLLQVEDQSGRKTDITTGHDWFWRPSWIGQSEWFKGETQDMRQLDSPPFTNLPISDWGAATIHAVDGLPGKACVQTELPAGAVVEPSGAPTRRLIKSRNGPKRLISSFPFGALVSGRVMLTISGKEADELEVRYFLDGQGPVSEDRFTTLGDGVQEILQTRFCRHTFTSVEVEYSVRSTLVESVVAVPVAPVVSAPLTLTTDHSTLNKLVDVICQSMRVAAQSAPLHGAYPAQQLPDLGYAATWTTWLGVHPGNVPVLTKWLMDAKAGFHQPGQIGPYAGSRVAMDLDGDEYARLESVTRLVWCLYRLQNNHALLADFYPDLRAAALAYRHQYPELLREPRPDLYGTGDGGSLVATASFYGHIKQIATIASGLGEHADCERLLDLAATVKDAFRKRFVTGDGHVVTDTVSALLAALHWRLLEESEEAQAQARLLLRVTSAKYQVGIVPAVVNALLPEITRAGRLDMAYMVLLQTTPTSWMGQMLAGNKLIYDDEVPDIAQAGILAWLIENVVGITLQDDFDSEQNGFRHLQLAPKPPLGAQFQAGAPFNEIDARFSTLYGEMAIAWQIGAQSFALQVLLPPGCSAQVQLPDGVEQRVQSGQHSFMMEYSRGRDGVPILREVTGG